MKIKTVNKISKVHGAIQRTYIYSDFETDREVHTRLCLMIKGRKNLVGTTFMGRWASFDEKVIKKGTNYFDLPDKEKKKLIQKAAKGANQLQREMVGGVDLAKGKDFSVKIKSIKCKNCNGKGYNSTIGMDMGRWVFHIVKLECPKCKGTGYMQKV